MNSRVDNMDLGTYLEQRVDEQLSYYEQSANRAKKAHSRTQMAIIVLSIEDIDAPS